MSRLLPLSENPSREGARTVEAAACRRYRIEFTDMDDIRRTVTIAARDAEDAQGQLCDALDCGVAIHSIRRPDVTP